MMLETYTDPPVLRINEYFCLECGGLKKLPDQLLFTPRLLRWCICEWPAMQKDFLAAFDYYTAATSEQHEPGGLRIVGDSPHDHERDMA